MKCKLQDIGVVTMGQSLKSEYYNTNKEGLPFLQGNRTFGNKYPSFEPIQPILLKWLKRVM